MPRLTRLCHVCGQAFATPDERNAHLASAHPGVSIKWGGPGNRTATIIEADGTERTIGKHDLERMRKAAREAAAVPAPPPPDPTDPEPLPIPKPEPGPRLREPRRPERAPRIAQAPAPGVPSRASLAEALPPATLAAVIRQVSISLSDLDGAGEPGHLSATEAATIAMLLHDSAIDAILRYFGGNVDRFKTAMAVAIILIAKGPIHARAIAARRREARANANESAAASYVGFQAEATGPDLVEYVPEAPAANGNGNGSGHPVPEPSAAPVDPLADLAARQRAWRREPHPEVEA